MNHQHICKDNLILVQLQYGYHKIYSISNLDRILVLYRQCLRLIGNSKLLQNWLCNNINLINFKKRKLGNSICNNDNKNINPCNHYILVSLLVLSIYHNPTTLLIQPCITHEHQQNFPNANLNNTRIKKY